MTTPRHKRIPKVSRARAAEWKIYTPLKLKFLSKHKWCERCMKAGKWEPSTCVHHHAGRRSNFIKVETWRSSCNSCNMFAKNNPKEARKEGWIAPVGVYLT